MSETSIEEVNRRHINLWVEIGVVLLVCVVPFLFTSLADLYLIDRRSRVSFLYHALSSLVRSAGSIGLVLYIIWRSGEPIERFGLRRFRFFPDVFGGICIWGVGWLSYRLLWFALPHMIGGAAYTYLLRHRYTLGYLLPSGALECALLAIVCLANGFAEELVMRAYLIPRFEELLGSTGLALLYSTALFAGYHTYQGTLGFINVAVLGFIQGASFCLLRRLAPVGLAHAIQDFYAIMART
jgi:membrane protease YdiL (CAAX protease family)